MSFDKDSLERTIVSTLKMLCKNGTGFQGNLTLQGLLGITVDNDVFLIQINENLSDADNDADTCSYESLQAPPKRPRQRQMVLPHQRRSFVPRTVPIMAARRGKNVAPRARPAFTGTSKLSMQSSSISKCFESNNRTIKTPKDEHDFETERLRDDIICLESDEDVAQVARPAAVVRRIMPKIEHTQVQHNMLDLVDSAINEARIIQQQSTFMSSENAMVYMDYDSSNYSRDVKPNFSTVPWTPTKPKISSLPGTPSTRVKAEPPFCTTPSSKVMHSPMRSPPVASGRASRMPPSSSPAQGRHGGSDSGSETTWTSVTQTTFVCTTRGCERRFTTKRAMVRHQKEKHFGDEGGAISSLEYEDNV